MRLIRRAAIGNFAEQHADALEPLLLWANAVEGSAWKSPEDVRRTFRSADFKGQFTVFDIGTNQYRVIAYVHYARDAVFLAMSPGGIDFDIKRYQRQLARTVPTSIESDDENNRVLAVIEELMEKGEDALTPREDAFLDVLVDLVYDFDEIHHPLPSGEPHKMVSFLLQQGGWTPQDLWPVLGSEGVVSEVLSGELTISGDQTKALGAFFHVGAWIFR